MGKECAAFGCTNRDTDKLEGLRFHRLPVNDPDRLNQWVRAISRAKWQPTKHDRICSDHFEANAYCNVGKQGRLKADAVPSVFPHFPSYMQPKPIKQRAARQRKTGSHTREQEPHPVVTTSSDHCYYKPHGNEPSVSALQMELHGMKKRLRAVERKLERRQQKIHNLNSLLDDLKEQRLLDREPANIISQYFQDSNCFSVQ